MRLRYYDNLKEIFFSNPDAERYVAGIEYLVSDKAIRDAEILKRQEFILNSEETKEPDMLAPPVAASDATVSYDGALASPVNAQAAEDVLAVSYLVHKMFIANFFRLAGSRDNPELLNRFAIAYATLLENFSLLTDESLHDAKFKQVSMDLLNSISNYDKSSEVALTLASRIVVCDLPAEFCLAALMQVNVSADPESQKKVMSILNTLYSKDSVWNSASTPSMALSVTPNTPQTMAALMHTTAATTGHYSRHAHRGNIAFLFHMQACWFTAGNMVACKFIDKCLPAAVASLIIYKDKIPEWCWVLETLAKFPEGSMQRRWRSRIVQNILGQYSESPEVLKSLGIKPKQCWTWLFSACSNERYLLDEYEPKAVVRGRQFILG